MQQDHDRQTGGFDETRRFSRRQVLGASLGLVAAGLGGSTARAASWARSPRPDAPQLRSVGSAASRHPQGVLGANFNGDPRVMSFAELRDVDATWVRGFFPMPDADHGHPAHQPAIQSLLAAADRGYGTVLSLKFPYFSKPIPTPGTSAMAAAHRRLDAVLPVVMGKVDILAIGNEPFIECQASDRDTARLNVFYETMASRVIAYRRAHAGAGSKTALYMGALNHLEQPAWRTAATERWMRFVRKTPSIAGTDIHPHLPHPGDGRHYLDYVLPRMRADQRFLATEFSLAPFFRGHLTDAVSPAFARRYHLQSGTPVWQVIRDALRQPFTQRKWNDLLDMTPWFANHRDFMRNQMESFRKTHKLAVATYGLGQDAAAAAGFGPHSVPWVLNSLFCQHTVRPSGDGLPGHNAVWTREFRSLQRR